ncbi:MAG: hypothetical protein FWC70_05590 [Defluviitaleaceae bacterium]|nr:hypothetical protein [Defluviitaleaceae bacterium]
MIHKPIYEPKGRANEYGGLAVNIYDGCNHGCYYCYARAMKERFTPKGFICNFNAPAPRRFIVESVKQQLAREKITGQLIHLCFTCDPYPAYIDTTSTRKIIKAIKNAGNNVQILTKGGKRAERDFDLLDAGDMFGVSLTGGGDEPDENEPEAASPVERLKTVINASHAGIGTWVSFEPVLSPEFVYGMITAGIGGGLYRIGVLNYHPSEISWGKFGARCVELCEIHGRKYELKEDLKSEMRKGGYL